MGFFKPNIEKMKKKRDTDGLIKALKDKNVDVREKAAEALGEIGGKRAIEPLTQALGDGDTDVWVAAGEALKKIGVAKTRIIGKGTVLLDNQIVYVPRGDEQNAIDAWNNVSFRSEADQLVAELFTIARKKVEPHLSPFLSTPSGKYRRNIRARQIGERLNQIGGIDLMRKAWWRLEVEFYRTGLREGRSLDLCWDGIGGWMG